MQGRSIKYRCYYCSNKIELPILNIHQLSQLNIHSHRTLDMLILLDSGWHITKSARRQVVCPECWSKVKPRFSEVGEVVLSEEDYQTISKFKDLRIFNNH